jgi:hypothetical protein
MKKPVAGYVFHVAIIGAPDIWRRIQIRSDFSLWELHEAIYEAYNRVDDHMFCFYVTKPGSRGRQAIRDAVEYAHPYTVEDAPRFGAEPPLCAYDGVLSELGLKTRRKFYYLTDERMKVLMKEAVNKLNTALHAIFTGEQDTQDAAWEALNVYYPQMWDKPDFDQGLLHGIELTKRARKRAKKREH